MTIDPGYLASLYQVVLSRRDASPDASYVASLFSKGRGKMAQKVGEEGMETALAAVSQSKGDVVNESADLLFHLLVLWAELGITVEDVLGEMKRREGISGLDEKALRKNK